MMDFDTRKNYDDSFFRDLYSSLTYFFYDTIEIVRVVEGEKQVVKVPVIPQSSKSDNYVKEFYNKKNKKCPDFPSVDQIKNIIPSGRIMMDEGISIDTSMVSNNGVRTKALKSTNNDFFSEMIEVYGRRTILSLDTRVLVQFKTSSIIDRFKLLERLLDVFKDVSLFYFSSKGYNKIPCNVMLTESFRLPNKSNYSFGINADNLHTMDVNFDLKTFYVLDNAREELTSKNIAETIDYKIKANYQE